MTKACDYALRDVAGRRFSREEIKQNIQYNLICEHNFESVVEIIARALSLCLLVLLHRRRADSRKQTQGRRHHFP